MEDFFQKWVLDSTLGKIVAVVLGIILVWQLIKLIQRRLVTKIHDNDRRYRMKKTTIFLGYLFSIIILFIVFSNKLSGITVALGVAGAGIAFALQEVISSVAGWMAITFGGFYNAGDRIQIGGIKGDVIDIGIIRTTLMETGQWVDGDLYNGRIVRIANSFVFKEPVFNYSADFPFLWDEIKIPLQYGTDYVFAKDIFTKIAREVAGDLTDQSRETWSMLVKKYKIENAQTEPMVTLVANDNWIEFTIRYVVNYKKRRTTKNEMFMKILAAGEKEADKIKFASATYQIVGMPDLRIKIQKD